MRSANGDPGSERGPSERPDEPGAPDRPGAPDEPGLLDELADRLGFRARLKATPALAVAYRVAVAVVGVAVVLIGLFLVPLPGPGWLIVFLGLGILASEFAWAERLLDFAKAKVRAWTAWLRRQPPPTRLLVGAAALVLLGALATAYVAWRGVPFT
jgi:uncharacterized protein (TIGR02611 family)